MNDYEAMQALFQQVGVKFIPAIAARAIKIEADHLSPKAGSDENDAFATFYFDAEGKYITHAFGTEPA